MSDQRDESGLTRREIIKLGAGAALAIGAWDSAVFAEPRPLLFFTADEFKLVDELTELIIPADDHSPGARAANVSAYIDFRLSESFEEEPKKLWRDGLRLIERLSREMTGKSFLESLKEERIALLKRISANELRPATPEEIFFRELKFRTVRAYYSSKIGIHDEMEYKGNVSIKEFVGYDAT